MSDQVFINGKMQGCGFHEQSSKLIGYFDKVDGMEQIMRDLCENSAHLQCLPEIKNKLLDSATGRNHIDMDTFRSIVKVFGMIVMGFLFVFVFLLTGAHFGWIGPLHQ